MGRENAVPAVVTVGYRAAQILNENLSLIALAL
jgi:hypothetical protein